LHFAVFALLMLVKAVAAACLNKSA
jgi:hypothetical protein